MVVREKQNTQSRHKILNKLIFPEVDCNALRGRMVPMLGQQSRHWINNVFKTFFLL